MNGFPNVLLGKRNLYFGCFALCFESKCLRSITIHQANDHKCNGPSKKHFRMVDYRNTDRNTPKYRFRFPNKTLGNPFINRYLVYAHPVLTIVCDSCSLLQLVMGLNLCSQLLLLVDYG